MGAPVNTLEGRLLCASGCAYAVMAGENLLDPQAAAPYFDGVGYQAVPAAFSSGAEKINACVVGTTGDGVVVAFRGTLPLNGPFSLAKLLDWVNDLNARPVPGDGVTGEVHAGFLESVDSLWPAVRAEVMRQVGQAGPATPLFITGHSKGGGMAPVAAMRFRNQESLSARVVTFAAPKSGSKAFADSYNAVMTHTRYEFAEDVVPHLPPSAPFLTMLGKLAFFDSRLAGLEQFDYERVGSLLYITRSLQIVPDPNEELLAQRRRACCAWRSKISIRLGTTTGSNAGPDT